MSFLGSNKTELMHDLTFNGYIKL